jgi:hypothetical protein
MIIKLIKFSKKYLQDIILIVAMEYNIRRI